LIIGIVVVVCAVYGGAAEVDDIVALYLKIDVLEADLFGVLVALVDKVAYDLPIIQII
jgi:hypothetical protein